MFVFCWLLAWVLFFSGCTTAPYSNRKQLMLISGEQLGAMGHQAFDQMLQQAPTTDNQGVVKYVTCVTQPIVDVVARDHEEDAPKEWRLAVVRDPSPNAFAVPGGNIGVNVGILKVAKTDDQLAAVLAHELGHNLANHTGERMSQMLLAQGGLAVLQGFAISKMPEGKQRLIMSALGLGAQVGLLLPFGRKQETEADIVGLNLMAKAGFKPEDAVALWQNMQAEHKGKEPPQFLSTHPSSGNRIERLQKEIPAVRPEYEKAISERSQGRGIASGGCARPSEAEIQALAGETRLRGR